MKEISSGMCCLDLYPNTGPSLICILFTDPVIVILTVDPCPVDTRPATTSRTGTILIRSPLTFRKTLRGQAHCSTIHSAQAFWNLVPSNYRAGLTAHS